MFRVNRNREAVKEFEGNSNNDYLTKSGIYDDVTIKALIYDEAANGGAVINYFVEHNGVPQVIYGQTRVYNIGGKDNEIGQKLINRLQVILDIDELGDPEEVELPIGKKGAMKTVAVFPNVEDEVITIRIVNEYKVWKNNIREANVVYGFYRNSDKATAEEILAAEAGEDVEFGAKYQKDLEYADNAIYKDDLTEEQVQAWIKAKRPKGTAGATVSKKPTFNRPKKFGK